MTPYWKWVIFLKTVLVLLTTTCSWKEPANAFVCRPFEYRSRLRCRRLGIREFIHKQYETQIALRVPSLHQLGVTTGYVAGGDGLILRLNTRLRAASNGDIQALTKSCCSRSVWCKDALSKRDSFGCFKASPRACRVLADINRTSSFCKELSIATPSSSIYQGLRGVYDYGAIGTKMLDSLRTILKAYFTEAPHEGILRLPPDDDDNGCSCAEFSDEHVEGALGNLGEYAGMGKNSSTDLVESDLVEDTPEYPDSLRDSVHLVETASLGPAALWKASGHLDKFSDDVVRCADTNETFRLDTLEYKSNGGTPPVYSIRFCEDGQKPQVVSSPRGGDSAENLWQPLRKAPLSVYPHLPSPVTGRCGSLLPPRQSSLMLYTNISTAKPKTDDCTDPPRMHCTEHYDQNSSCRDVAYLRPETAQNIFVSYPELLPASWRSKLPFGVAQEGRAYRNESQTARTSFILRMREFRQFEIEYFVHPTCDRNLLMDRWKEHLLTFFKAVGIPSDCLAVSETHRDDLAHYAERSLDFIYNMKWSSYPGDRLTESPKEICGLALRGCFDLTKHQKASGKNLQVSDTSNSVPGSMVLPHVIEASIGIDRLLFVLIHSAMSRDKVKGRERFFLNLHPALAPFKVAVFPVVSNNSRIVSLALKSYRGLRQKFSTLWDESGSIGKRYRKADAMGIPFCISFDDDSLSSQWVQVRWRNTAEQRKVRLAMLPGLLRSRLQVQVPANLRGESRSG